MTIISFISVRRWWGPPNWICIELASWNNYMYLRKDISFRSETISWFQADLSFHLLLNDKYQFYSLWFKLGRREHAYSIDSILWYAQVVVNPTTIRSRPRRSLITTQFVGVHVISKGLGLVGLRPSSTIVRSWWSVLLKQRPKNPEKNTVLLQFIDKLYHLMLHRVHLAVSRIPTHNFSSNKYWLHM